MWSGKNLQLLCILPFGMVYLSATSLQSIEGHLQTSMEVWVDNKPTACLVQPIVAHCCEVMYFGCLDFRGELGFLNCDDVGMCVVNKQFKLLEFVFEYVYVDLQ